MTPELKSFILDLRQHPLFQQLLNEIEPPRFPEYKKAETLEQFGAKAVFASGQMEQHNRWYFTLGGTVPAREANPSDIGDKT